jgi:hypothetical protein
MGNKTEPTRAHDAKKHAQKRDKKIVTPEEKKGVHPSAPTGYHGTDDERTLNPEE